LRTNEGIVVELSPESVCHGSIGRRPNFWRNV
jgi:hypothetical protein